MGGTPGGPFGQMNFEEEYGMSGIFSNAGEEGGPRELEVFLQGGAYDFKKAKLDQSKSEETIDGKMIRVNQPIDENVKYTVFIPKKLS